jgi:phosphoglycerate dehydrogenase-like enzyme
MVTEIVMPALGMEHISLPNVVATPHISCVTKGMSRGRAQCVADNIERVAARPEPLYRVV